MRSTTNASAVAGEVGSVVDATIVAQACFPLHDACVDSAQVAMARLTYLMSQRLGRPLSYVIWPNGTKAVVELTAGARTGEAKRVLVKVFRAAEAGRAGVIDTGVQDD